MARDRRQEDVAAIVRRSLRAGDPTGWFDALYAAADGDTAAVPWQRGSLHPHVAGWLREALDDGAGPADLSPCLVVGAGLGDDAAALARMGLVVTAFDVAPTAVRWARERHGDVDVRWVTADLLDPPTAWHHAFASVVEVRTIQSLPLGVRSAAARNLNGFVAEGGTLVAAVLSASTAVAAEQHEGPPWAVPPEQLDVLLAGLDVRSRSTLDGPVGEVGYVATRPSGSAIG